MAFYHAPVLLNEVLEGLSPRDGLYLDCTVGGGGHAAAILAKCEGARLIGIDRDGEALTAAAERLAPFAGRFRLYRANYKEYEDVLRQADADKLDGVLLDLGISSHQIDDPARGFSYRTGDAPLDMRMDRRQALTAETVVNDYAPEELLRILREYGEESFASLIVRNLVKAREKKRIGTCGELARIAEESIPAKFRTPACARKTFQAIRIEVNGELDGLRECIRGLAGKLKKGGRMCVITFHSLEDRIVKQTYADLEADCICPKNFPVCVCGKKREAEAVNKKPITASEREIAENPRSKSAKLRILKKTV